MFFELGTEISDWYFSVTFNGSEFILGRSHTRTLSHKTVFPVSPMRELRLRD